MPPIARAALLRVKALTGEGVSDADIDTKVQAFRAYQTDMPTEIDGAGPVKEMAEKMFELFPSIWNKERLESEPLCREAILQLNTVPVATSRNTYQFDDDCYVVMHARLKEIASKPVKQSKDYYFICESLKGTALYGQLVPKEVVQSAITNGFIVEKMGQGFVQMGSAQVMVSDNVPAEPTAVQVQDGDDGVFGKEQNVHPPSNVSVAKTSVAGAAEMFGFKTASGLRVGHTRVAKDVLNTVFKVSDFVTQWIYLTYAELRGTAHFLNMERFAAIVDQRLKTCLAEGKSREDVLIDDTIEICLSAIGAFDWFHKTGDAVGAQSVDALASSGGFLLGSDVREKAIKSSRDSYKLHSMHSNQPYMMGQPKGKDGFGFMYYSQKGKGQGFANNFNGESGGPGMVCYACGGVGHIARDCPSVLGKNKGFGKGKAGKAGKGAK